MVHERQRNLQRINSVTASMDVFPIDRSLPMHRLRSVGSGVLQRAASETFLRGGEPRPHTSSHVSSMQVRDYCWCGCSGCCFSVWGYDAPQVAP